ncbi:hypothetical protein [Butyrivibrio sp. AE2032]|uniref:hypothetical protein n=1 Tax=Butyrivibrio sp. AE2032 TaxID=1458463 RepID=UPI00055537AE|nr:hypothetical protein [Butyrivibrio sp. AE2032]
MKLFSSKPKTYSKGQKIVSRILLILLILVTAVFVGARLFFRIPVLEYYWASDKAFKIPGLSENMVPQGLDYVASEGIDLVGGYQKDGSPSRIYRVDHDTGKNLGYVVMGDAEGNGVRPHAGGLAAHGDFLFVAGDEDASIYIYRLSDVLSGKDGETVKRAGEFSTKFGDEKVNVAWICFAEDRMIIGEFYRVPNYLTPESHFFTGPSGEENHAVALCYRLTDTGAEDSVCGVETTPFMAYSLPGLVQGMAVYDGKLWISQSYGTAQSSIRCYDVEGTEQTGVFGVEDGGIPVYTLDSTTQVYEFEAPPMAEEIIFVDGKLYIMCESASSKYFFGNLTGGRWCYATDVDKLTEKSAG